MYIFVLIIGYVFKLDLSQIIIIFFKRELTGHKVLCLFV